MIFVYSSAQIFFGSIAWLLSKFWFSVEVRGTENIRDAKGPLILVSNHKSLGDHFLILSSIPRFWKSPLVPIIIMTHDRYFEKFLTHIFFKMLGTYPAQRGVGYDVSLARPIEVLKEGGVVGIYPEGHTVPGNSLGDFKKGIGELIKRSAGVPIIPIAIHVPERLFLEIMPLPGARFSVRFGVPFYPESSRSSEDLTALVKERIAALFYE